MGVASGASSTWASSAAHAASASGRVTSMPKTDRENVMGTSVKGRAAPGGRRGETCATEPMGKSARRGAPVKALRQIRAASSAPVRDPPRAGQAADVHVQLLQYRRILAQPVD